MKQSMSLRPAVSGDASRIEAIASAAYTPYVEAIGRPPAPMCADFPAQIADGHVWVCETDGAVAGFAVFFARDNKMFLENLAVDPSFMGMGIGRALLDFCEDRAIKLGLSRVELYTNEKMTANLTLYPHLGYRETGRQRQDGFNRVFFEKTLDKRS